MDQPKKSWLHLQLLALITFIYALSFFLPAVQIDVTESPRKVDGKVVDPGGNLLARLTFSGAEAFRKALDFGMAPLSRSGVMWLANPVFWLGGVLLALRKHVLAGIAGLLAAALVLVPDLLGRLTSEGEATRFLGFWIWFASPLLLSVAGFGLWWRDTATNWERATPL